MKKVYENPRIKLRLIESEGMICTSDPETITGGTSPDPISGGTVDSKEDVQSDAALFGSHQSVWED